APLRYSPVFLPPLNGVQIRLVPLSGLVETDVFYGEVSFPAVLMIGPGKTLTLSRGTPLVEVIPIKREEFQAEFVAVEAEKYNVMNLSTRPLPENKNYYKNNLWRKKTYR